MAKKTTTVSDPVRLHILKTMCEGIRTITPGNGYVLDLSGAEGTADNKVFRGRALFGHDDPIPMISILESPIPLDQLEPPRDGELQYAPWELVIQGFFEDDKDNPCDVAYVGLADVKKYLASEKKKANADRAEDMIFGLGRVVAGMAIGQGVVRPPDEISEKAYFWLTVTLDIAEDLNEPYEV